MKKYLPNSITCLNLLSGCIGIVLAFQGKLESAAYAIALAALFDFLDGMLARVLNAYSPMGKELDSLADMVSFGLLPSVIIYQLFLHAPQPEAWSPWFNFSAFLIAIFSALRLAKFNIDTRQSENFIGLTTTANALLIASLPLILGSNESIYWTACILNPFFLVLFSLGMGLLLVSELPLLSLKFKNFDLKSNFLRYILILASITLLLVFKFTAVPMIVIFYILLSVISFRFTGNTSTKN